MRRFQANVGWYADWAMHDLSADTGPMGVAPLENRTIGFGPHLVILFQVSGMEKHSIIERTDVGSPRSQL